MQREKDEGQTTVQFKKTTKLQKKCLTNIASDDILSRQIADVAELADAHDSGSCEITLIGVQVPSSA